MLRDKLHEHQGEMLSKAKYKELMEVLELVISISNEIGISLEDGKITSMEYINLFKLMTLVPAAFKDSNKIVNEVKSLNFQDFQDIHQYFVEKFDIPQDNIESVIEKCITIVLKIVELVKDFSEMFSERKDK